MTNLEQVQNILRPGLALYMAYDKASADGKYDLNDLGYLMAVFPAFAPFASSLPGAVQAFDDVSDDAEQFAMLKQWVSDEFDIGDDEVEAKIEKGIKVALDLGDLLLDIRESDDEA